MKNLKLIAVLLALFLAGCTDSIDLTEDITKEQEKLMSKEEIDNIVLESLRQNGEFDWSSVDNRTLWSAAVHGGGLMNIGYQPESEGDISGRMADIDINARSWTIARNAVIDLALDVVNQVNDEAITRDDLNVESHEVLPFIDIKLLDIEAIRELRSMANVRYIEPLGYEADFINANQSGRELSGSGCGANNADNSIPSSDYTLISPYAKASWNYGYAGITSAWSYSTGRGITVGLIDTGVSSSQSRLGSSFNSGYSSGRFIQKYGFYKGDGSNDKCGHGTSMAGVIASPRTNNGVPVGVAYNANLVSARGTSDVVVNSSSEKTGVANSLTYLGNRSDVKIISMSIGDVFSSGKVKDAIRYANGRGKLIFAAAGTSTSFTNWFGVIFPANMSETVAVTGIKEQSSYKRCDICHSGRKVDFSIIMERNGSKNHPLTLAQSGDTPSTVGGSSVATATAAGIAALVWARHPSWNKTQVLNKLKQSSALYPSKSSSYGYGTINAYNAVR
ncbi:MAG: S8 family serine peptidase [Bacteroidota bacterium]